MHNRHILFLNILIMLIFLIFFNYILDTFLLDNQVLCDVDCGKEFILCEYNRDADSYRYAEPYVPKLCLVFSQSELYFW